MPIKYLKITVALTITIMAITGCSKIEDGSLKPPLVYRIDIQQGNVVDQSMVNKLRVGMDKKQVRFIMGTPLLMDPFHDERWEYLYTYQEGGEDRQKRHITLFFEDEKLAYIRGDIKVTNVPTRVDETNTEKSVIVPENISNKTLLERWLSDEPEPSESKSAEETNGKTDQEKAEDQALVDEEKQLPDETPPETALETSPEEIDDESEPAEEVASKKESGFFSKLWDKLSGGDDDALPADAEVLKPELENK